VTTLEDEPAHASQSPKWIAERLETSAAFVDQLRRARRLQDSGRFRPSEQGTRARLAGDRLDVRDGPFAAEGNTLDGQYWVEASGVNETAEVKRLTKRGRSRVARVKLGVR
jgi:hypothetical protein